MSKKIITVIAVVLTAALAFMTILYVEQTADRDTTVESGGQQDTIDALTEEIIELKAQLEAAENNTGDEVENAAEQFLKLYYDIDSDNHDENTYIEEIGKYVTDQAAEDLMLYEHGSGGFTDDGVEYHSEIYIEQLYYDSDGTDKANIFCRGKIISSFDNNLPTTAPIFISLDMVFENGIWLVDGVTNYGI